VVAAQTISVGVTPNVLYALPFFCPVDTTFTEASFLVWSNGTNGKGVVVGVYANNNGNPSTLEFGASTTISGTFNTHAITGLSWLLSSGWHWLVFASEDTNLNVRGVDMLLHDMSTWVMGAAGLGNGAGGCVKSNWTYSSTLPSTFPSPAVVYDGTNAPMVFLRL
jgi:hypothetical protein